MIFFNFEPVLGNGLNLLTKGANVNISESDADFGIEVALPGFEKEDFVVNVEKDTLTISAEKKVEKTEEDTERKYVRQEFGYGKFTRSFHLPESVDSNNISATYSNGILHLTLPKEVKEIEKAKTIEIS